MLPGARVGEGATVLAGWGAATWLGVMHWDDRQPDPLWLEPTGVRGRSLQVRAFHPTALLTERLLQSLAELDVQLVQTVISATWPRAGRGRPAR